MTGPQFSHRKCEGGCGGNVSRMRWMPGINSSAEAFVHMLSAV